MDRLAKHTKEYNEGLIENVEWLDGFTFSCVEKIKKRVIFFVYFHESNI